MRSGANVFADQFGSNKRLDPAWIFVTGLLLEKAKVEVVIPSHGWLHRSRKLKKAPKRYGRSSGNRPPESDKVASPTGTLGTRKDEHLLLPTPGGEKVCLWQEYTENKNQKVVGKPVWCNVQSALRTLAEKVAQSKLTINSFPWQSYLTRRGKNPKQNPDSRTMSRIWTQRIVRRMDIGVTKFGQCNIRSTKHVLVEISNFFDPPNIFCTKPNGSIYSINISGRESALAAKRERVVYTLEPERARSLLSTSALQGSPRWSETVKAPHGWLLGCWGCEDTKILCAWMAQKSCIEVRLSYLKQGSHAADHIRFHVELCEEGSFKRVFIFAWEHVIRCSNLGSSRIAINNPCQWTLWLTWSWTTFSWPRRSGWMPKLWLFLCRRTFWRKNSTTVLGVFLLGRWWQPIAQQQTT